MVYLNRVKKGGGTHFVTLDQTFVPETGRAVVWSNLNADGSVNARTLHQGQPVEEGEKHIVTVWFRERPWVQKNGVQAQSA